MRQLTLALASPPEPTFANFVPGRNAEALQTLRALVRGEIEERFVYLWGAPGSGRSHLLHAFARESAQAGRSCLLVDRADAEAALSALEPNAALIVCEVERLDARAQRALFVAFNRLREAGGVLVASGQSAPAHARVRRDLATRLAWGLVYEVHPLSDDDKAQAMAARAAALGFDLAPEAQAYLLRHGRRDLPSLLEVVDLIDRRSLESQRAVTLPLVREALRMADGGRHVGGEKAV